MQRMRGNTKFLFPIAKCRGKNTENNINYYRLNIMNQKAKKHHCSYDELKALARNIRRSVIKMVAQNEKS